MIKIGFLKNESQTMITLGSDGQSQTLIIFKLVFVPILCWLLINMNVYFFIDPFLLDSSSLGDIGDRMHSR